MRRSPSWQLAEDLAQAMDTFSLAACKAALEKVGNDPNAAAVWLLEQGSELEQELAGRAEEQEEKVYESFAMESEDEEEFSKVKMLRTASFRPAGDSLVLVSDSPPKLLAPQPSKDTLSLEGKIDFDEVRAATRNPRTSSQCTHTSRMTCQHARMSRIVCAREPARI